MPFGNSIESTCKECGNQFVHLKKLSEHIKKVHGMSSIDYVIKHNHDGKRPTCLHCGGETRFVSLGDGFKKYCAADRKIAESSAGRIGGRIKRQWNKGLTKESDMRIAATAIKTSGAGNSFYGKKHNATTISKIADKKRLSFDDVIKRIISCSSNTEVLSTSDDYADQNSILKIKCTLCNTPDIETSFNIQRCWRCKVCYPVASKQQLEIADYVKSIIDDEVIISTRDVIPPLEIDVWIPTKNVAIEYHGLYWHSGGKEGVFDKKRHRSKYLECKNKGIKLLQIFSDEWTTRNETVKSMISHSLGISTIKLNARDCKVICITSRESKPFLDVNHVNGSTRAAAHYALIHPTHGTIGVATVRKPIQKKWGEGLIELARMAFKHNICVRGGASKLLKRIVDDYKLSSSYVGLLTYAELRYGEGSVYEKCGMTRVDDSKINYWYTDGISRYDRFKYRAQPGKPESQVAAEANVRPVYGCGNATYLLKF